VKRTAVHVKFGTFKIEGLEKRKSHQMIPVGVGEEKMNVVNVFFGQLVAKPSNTGTGIDSNNILAFGANFQTGCIAAVF
jgi:hypothetical protein